MMKLTTLLAFSSGILMALASDLLPRQTNPPLLFFNSIQELTACASGTISWIYAGPDAAMTLQITNNGVQQLPPPSSTSSSLSRTPTNGVAGRAVPTGVDQPSSNITTITLSSNISPLNSSSFSWARVTIHQGTYIATASIPSLQYNTRSLTFFVQESTDTSCLPPVSTSTSSTSTVPSTSTSSDPSSTVFPVHTASSVNKGAIAGGVVGGVVLLLGVLVLYLFFIRSKRSAHPPSAPSYTGGSGAAFGMRRKGWGGLSSVDSNTGAATYTGADVPKRKRSKLRSPRMYQNGGNNVRQQSHPDSLGSPMVDEPSEEEIQSSRSGNGLPLSSEKFSSSDEFVGMANLPVNVGRRQSSLTESLYNEFSSGGGATGTKRRTSVNSTVSLPPGAKRRSMDSSAPMYPTPTTYTASPTTSSQSPSTSSPNVAAVVGMDLATSGTSSQLEKKRTPRKPVPAYVPSSSPPPAINSEPSISTPTSLITPSPPFATEAEVEAQHRSSGHYGVSSRSVGPEPQLSHKSSFGPGGVEGKPLHYLIPDMPSAASS